MTPQNVRLGTDASAPTISAQPRRRFGLKSPLGLAGDDMGVAIRSYLVASSYHFPA